jgi:histidyl-tRNA synthetase
MAVHAFPSIKRYHIGKVYRRDTPNMSKGRYREFYQCDFDIAGANYGKMIPDAEVLKVICEILNDLNLGKFLLKINHRKLLDAMIALSDIPSDKFKTVCASVDKLDKEPWEAVKKELIEKGLNESQTDKLWIYVQLKDTPEKLLEKLKADSTLLENKSGKEAIDDMEVLIDYISILNITQFISFDLSLARDYYTGLIFEAVLIDGDFLGSIAGGGRYDELLGMFSGKSIPAIGGSIGIERVFNILEEKMKKETNVRQNETEVLVAVIGKNMTKDRFKVLNELWENNIKAEILYNENPRMDKQMDFALDNRVPFILFIGENEVKEGKIKIKVNI